MANEIFYSGNGAQLRAAETNAALWLLLSNIQSVRRLVMNMGDAGGSGSAVHQVGQVKFGDSMAAVAENASTSNTALTSSEVTITIARQAIQRQTSTLMEITGNASQYQLTNPGLLAQDGANAAAARFAAMIAGLHSGLSNSVGTSGADLTVDDMYDGIAQLESVGNDGPYVSLLHPQQFSDFRTSLRGESSSVFQPPDPALLTAGSNGFKGTWNGVQMFTNSQVPTANAGADRDGSIFAPGAFVYREASISTLSNVPGLDVASLAVPDGSPIYAQFEHDASGALHKVVFNYFVGVAEGEDERGVRVISDA